MTPNETEFGRGTSKHSRYQLTLDQGLGQTQKASHSETVY